MSLAVKRVGPNTIEGLAIPFHSRMPSGKDLTGERFDASTDLCLDWFGNSGRPLLYDHGLDSSHKAVKIGRQDDFEMREEGYWAQSQLDMNAKYRKAVDRLIEEQALGYSAGAMPHLATKNAKTGVILRFPVVELSLTPMPAEPMTLGVHYTKSVRDGLALLEDVDVDIPDPIKSALSALDDWAETRDEAPAAESYANEYDRLLVGVKAFVDRSSDLADLRVKSGRTLSSANRQRLADLRERVAATSATASEVLADIDALLTETDPEATKALWAATFEALATEAKMLGVDLTALEGLNT